MCKNTCAYIHNFVYICVNVHIQEHARNYGDNGALGSMAVLSVNAIALGTGTAADVKCGAAHTCVQFG